jgi:hypothetical protein
MSYPGLPALIGSQFYGVKDRCLEFDGTNDYVDCGNDGAFDFGTGDFSVECWILKENQSSTELKRIITNGAATDDAGQAGFAIVASDNNCGVLINPSGARVLLYVGAGNMPTDTWFHLAFTVNRSADTMLLYINRVQQNSRAAPVGSVTSAYDLTLGKYAHTNSYYFAGKLDDLRVWNTSRTPDQIKRYMYTRLYGTETGLVAYYPMNEGTGSTAYDKSTNSNDGTITGATWITP